MSRNSKSIVNNTEIIINEQNHLLYGLFLTNSVKIKNNTVFIRDISGQSFSFDFQIKQGKDRGTNGIPIFINQTANIAFSKEENLLESFKNFGQYHAARSKPVYDISKKYWESLENESILFRFLSALHNYDQFSSKTDYIIGNSPEKHHYLLMNDEDYIKKLCNNLYGLDSSIGGLLYINENNKVCVLPYFFPAQAYSFLKNKEGKYHDIPTLKMAPSLYNYINAINNSFIPKGIYSFKPLDIYLKEEKDELI